MTSPISILGYQRPSEFRMGDVLMRSWSVLSRHFPVFLLLVGIAHLPPLILQLFLVHQSRLAATFESFLILILQMILSALAEAMVIFASFQDLRGRAVSAATSAAVGLQQIVPVVLVSIFVGVIAGLGFLLFVIPGLIAIASFAVAMPVCVVEQLGPSASISRSWDLTSGHRWPIFGVLVVIGVVSIIGSSMLRGALFSAGPMVQTSVVWVWSTLLNTFQAVFAALLYHDLRAVREGIGIDEIAAVFD